MVASSLRALSMAALLVGAACSFDRTGLPGVGGGDLDPIGDAPGLVDAPGIPDAPPADAVRPDAPGIPDAMTGGAPDAASCPAACDSCGAGGICIIECADGECNSGVACPPGRPCRVTCDGDGACESGLVDCTMASSCEVRCIGADACDTGVRCGGTTCSVLCQGSAACEDGGVDCSATTCNIVCDGASACKSHTCCGGSSCGSSCESQNGGCCSCGGC